LPQSPWPIAWGVRPNKPSEQVSTTPLVLFLDALKRSQGEPAPAGEATDDHAALVVADDEL
jgi:hypothetical protein